MTVLDDASVTDLHYVFQQSCDDEEQEQEQGQGQEDTMEVEQQHPPEKELRDREQCPAEVTPEDERQDDEGAAEMEEDSENNEPVSDEMPQEATPKDTETTTQTQQNTEEATTEAQRSLKALKKIALKKEKLLFELERCKAQLRSTLPKSILFHWATTAGFKTQFHDHIAIRKIRTRTGRVLNDLNTALLELDSILSLGNEEVRMARKRLVNLINTEAVPAAEALFKVAERFAALETDWQQRYTSLQQASNEMNEAAVKPSEIEHPSSTSEESSSDSSAESSSESDAEADAQTDMEVDQNDCDEEESPEDQGSHEREREREREQELEKRTRMRMQAAREEEQKRLQRQQHDQLRRSFLDDPAFLERQHRQARSAPQMPTRAERRQSPKRARQVRCSVRQPQPPRELMYNIKDKHDKVLIQLAPSEGPRPRLRDVDVQLNRETGQLTVSVSGCENAVFDVSSRDLDALEASYQVSEEGVVNVAIPRRQRRFTQPRFVTRPSYFMPRQQQPRMFYEPLHLF